MKFIILFSSVQSRRRTQIVLLWAKLVPCTVGGPRRHQYNVLHVVLLSWDYVVKTYLRAAPLFRAVT